MPTLATIHLSVSACEVLTVRYYHTVGGWHYLHVESKKDDALEHTAKDRKVSRVFGPRSRAEKVLDRDLKRTIGASVRQISAADKDGLLDVLSAGRVEVRLGDSWVECKIPRGGYTVRQARAPYYELDFTMEVNKYV